MEEKIDEILLANFNDGDWQSARKQLVDLFAVIQRNRQFTVRDPMPSMIGSIVKFKANHEKILEGMILDKEQSDNLYYLIKDSENNLRIVLAAYITEIVKQFWK